MDTKKFKMIDEGFTCIVCGNTVEPLSYTARDHCPNCLCSIHIDDYPGDRLCKCLGVLRPIDIEKGKKDSLKIIYRCDKCGIKIPIKSYNQVVSDMAANIERIINNPSIITELSKGVIECSQKFMWANRIQIFNDVYDRLIKKYFDMRNNENIKS